ncbi:hypothetical protein PPL_04963 [Heterostelium album PN500]|uniref:Uncharacterized protein n=1 Tax=Heterostelium pallidum (strain ATCC 26659 / Pp 5 / PN500) TaxID=670386 RepID=D3B919_HETP5|nr:hypothetical protein PPL_04963 [Heterostelium album PN500]EFA82058.1 hypothetical protein PPL_04963 [Heterostelium album PN500]|eukprot:XP_020434175.1 hypothetical protein PPL_04963 [Heterostelium album PN500]
MILLPFITDTSKTFEIFITLKNNNDSINKDTNSSESQSIIPDTTTLYSTTTIMESITTICYYDQDHIYLINGHIIKNRIDRFNIKTMKFESYHQLPVGYGHQVSSMIFKGSLYSVSYYQNKLFQFDLTNRTITDHQIDFTPFTACHDNNGNFFCKLLQIIANYCKILLRMSTTKECPFCNENITLRVYDRHVIPCYCKYCDSNSLIRDCTCKSCNESRPHPTSAPLYHNTISSSNITSSATPQSPSSTSQSPVPPLVPVLLPPTSSRTRNDNKTWRTPRQQKRS